MKTLCLTNLSSDLSISLVEEINQENITRNILLDLYLNNGNQIEVLSFIIDFIKNFENFENIDRIFVTTGPGYFTTIRITCLIAQTISFTLKKELTYIDTFKALENLYNTLHKDDIKKMFLVKIARKRYRIKYNETNLETTNFTEIIGLSKKQNLKLVYNNLNSEEIKLLEEEKVDFEDLSNIYRAGIVYLSSKNNLEKSYDYNLKITY